MAGPTRAAELVPWAGENNTRPPASRQLPRMRCQVLSGAFKSEGAKRVGDEVGRALLLACGTTPVDTMDGELIGSSIVRLSPFMRANTEVQVCPWGCR